MSGVLAVKGTCTVVDDLCTPPPIDLGKPVVFFFVVFFCFSSFLLFCFFLSEYFHAPKKGNRFFFSMHRK